MFDLFRHEIQVSLFKMWTNSEYVSYDPQNSKHNPLKKPMSCIELLTILFFVFAWISMISNIH